MITKQELEQYTLKEIDNSFNSAIERWIEQTTLYIETFTGREFRTPDEETTRLFDGTGTTEMLIGDCYNIDGVTVAGEEYEVIAYPANKEQKYKITANRTFKLGRQNVAVTAMFGFEEIPEDIRFACLVLVAGIVNVQVNAHKSSESIGNYSVSYETESQRDDFKRATQILQMYRTIPI
jgi:hypothetical protein